MVLLAIFSGKADRKMPKLSMKRLALVFLLVNLVVIGASIISGYRRGNVAYRFAEKQAIPFFSSNQLAATSLLDWIIYLLKRKLITMDRAYNRIALFWAISAFGFFIWYWTKIFRSMKGWTLAFFACSAIRRSFARRCGHRTLRSGRGGGMLLLSS